MSFLKNAWYCASWSADLGTEPIGRRILDEPILLFRKADGAVTALSDMCPHRFAPLSKGRLESDVIECPYHGLKFDAAGTCVLNPHGAGRIPANARLRRYPLVERHGAAWIWMGHADAADTAQIPDLRLFGDDSYPRVKDHLVMKIDYRLLIDNLLDLTHAAYLHPDTLTPGEAQRRAKFSGTATTAKSHYLITPETETSCHYFWVSTRNRLADNEAIDAGIKKIVNYAFLAEDEPMMISCQDYMAGRDFFDLDPLYLETDAAAARARRLLADAIAAEQMPNERRSAA